MMTMPNYEFRMWSSARHAQGRSASGGKAYAPARPLGRYSAVVAAFFILNSAFFIQPAFAQRACMTDADCAGSEGFRCVSERCNLPPPIWNVQGTGLATTGQVGSFYVRQSSVVGDRLGIGTVAPSEKLELRDDTAGIARLRITETGAGQNPEIQLKYGIGDSDHWALYVDRASGDLRIWRGENRLQLQADGTLRLPTGNIELGRDGATVDGLNLDAALTGITVSGGGLNVNQTGRSVALSLARCANSGEILKWSGTAWACAADAAGAGGGGGTLTGSGAAGQLAFWTGLSSLGTDSGLVWNAGANRLGIGVALPASALDVSGDVRFSGTLQAGSVPWARLTLPETSQCAPDRYVSAITAGGVTCGTPVAGGRGGPEVDPLYTAWYNNGNPTVTGALTVNTDVRVNGIISRTAGADNIWIGDNNDTVQVQGSVSVGGCLGPVVVGATAAPGVNGNLNGTAGGYRGIDGLCNSAFGGSHQCTTNEVLTSIHCGAIWTDGSKNTLRAAIPAGAQEYVWISNGAPSLPTPTNDCYGWTQTAVLGGEQSQGIAWNFNARGGAGYARPCNEQNRIVCCR